MQQRGLTAFQKGLLYFTAIVVTAFFFTVPTKNNRSTVDKIRLHVGAEHLVSQETLKEVNAGKSAKNRVGGRQPASVPAKAAVAPVQKKVVAKPAQLGKDKRKEVARSVMHYCNKQYNQSACSQWLNYCGDSCRLLVSPNTWTKLAKSTTRKGR